MRRTIIPNKLNYKTMLGVCKESKEKIGSYSLKYFCSEMIDFERRRRTVTLLNFTTWIDHNMKPGKVYSLFPISHFLNFDEEAVIIHYKSSSDPA